MQGIDYVLLEAVAIQDAYDIEYSSSLKVNYLPFYGRIREIRSSDRFCSVPYLRVGLASPASGLL